MKAPPGDKKLYDALAILGRHLRECHGCNSALKVHDTLTMCQKGILLTLEAADGYKAIITLRRKAHNHPGGMVIACPDPSQHGKSYPLVATPLMVTAYQDGMF